MSDKTGILNQYTTLIKETNETLKNFVDISIQQFQGQQKFNEQFQLQFEKQNIFNERFLNKLDDIEKALKK